MGYKYDAYAVLYPKKLRSVMQMYGIAIMNSSNYVLKLHNILGKKGYVFEVISTPCHIAKSGCSYSLKFPLEYMDLVLREAQLNNIAILEIYKIVPLINKNKYEKIY